MDNDYYMFPDYYIEYPEKRFILYPTGTLVVRKVLEFVVGDDRYREFYDTVKYRIKDGNIEKPSWFGPVPTSPKEGEIEISESTFYKIEKLIGLYNILPPSHPKEKEETYNKIMALLK